LELLEFLGTRIKDRILGSGVRSVEKFALENGIPKSTLSELLNGKNDPRLTTLAKICAGLDIPLSDLLDHAAIDGWVRESAAHYEAKTGDSKTGDAKAGARRVIKKRKP
jgi:transcriptional regulator with XRE-family HTH domain